MKISVSDRYNAAHSHVTHYLATLTSFDPVHLFRRGNNGACNWHAARYVNVHHPMKRHTQSASCVGFIIVQFSTYSVRGVALENMWRFLVRELIKRRNGFNILLSLLDLWRTATETLAVSNVCFRGVQLNQHQKPHLRWPESDLFLAVLLR